MCVSLYTASCMDVPGVSLSTAKSMDVQCRVYPFPLPPICMDVQDVSLSITKNIDVQGVSLSTIAV